MLFIGCILWSKSYCVRQVYLTKSCQPIWWRVSQPFILFIHFCFFVIQTLDRMQFFTILRDKLRSFNFKDDRRFLCTINYRIDYSQTSLIRTPMGQKQLSTLLMSRNLARQISRDLHSYCFAMVLTAGFYCDSQAHNVRKVRVVKYIVVYGQIKAADQNYCHNQKWRRKLLEISFRTRCF